MKQQNGNGLEAYVFGKVQPQALDLEEAVLGGMLLDKEGVVIVAEILRPEDFYKPANETVCRAIFTLYAASHPVDLLTVQEQLKKTGELKSVGGAAYLAGLTNMVASAANIEYHARIIAQKSITRKLIHLSSGIIRDAYEETTDIFDLINTAEEGVFQIVGNTSGSIASMGEASAAAVKHMHECQKAPDGLTGVPTGLTHLDRLTGGLQKTDLIVIAARPGMGKTALTLLIAKSAAEFGRGVAIFSLEMSKLQIANRLISIESEISGEKIRTGKLNRLEENDFIKAAETLSSLPIYIDDTPAITPFEIRSKCRRLKIRHDIQLVIVDYLQLMGDNNDTGKRNREQEVSSFSRAMKALAKELDVPVIAISQLSRAVETRGGSKRPQLSDLRESGSIEQDSDFVGFIYRPEYYEILEDEEGNSLKGVSELIIAKNRHGALRTIKLGWKDKSAKFCDIDDLHTYAEDFPVLEDMTIPEGSKGDTDEDLPF